MGQWTGLKAAQLDGRIWFCLCDVFARKYISALCNSEVRERTYRLWRPYWIPWELESKDAFCTRWIWMNLGVQLQQKRIPQSGDRSKPFLWRLWRRRLTHSCSDAILMCLSNASDFVNDTLAKPCKKHCPSRLFKFCCRCCNWALTRILQCLLRCFLSNPKNLERIIIFKVERLSCSEFRMQPPPFRSLSDRCQPAGLVHNTSTHWIEILWQRPSCGSQNGSESSPCIAEADLVSVILLMESIQLLQKVRGKNAPDCIIRISYLDTAGMLDKATVPSDMSLSLHIGCGFSPWCGGLAHLHLAGTASATLRKTHLTCKKKGNLHQWLTRFQVATERCRDSCKSVIRWCFLPPSGMPQSYPHYLPQMATCPRKNRQPVNLLETNRFEYVHMMINQSCIGVISHYILTLFWVLFLRWPWFVWLKGFGIKTKTCRASMSEVKPNPSNSQDGISRTWIKFLVSCLRLGSSGTNTAARREDLNAIEKRFCKSRTSTRFLINAEFCKHTSHLWRASTHLKIPCLDIISWECQTKQLCRAIWASVSTLVPCSALDAEGWSTWRKGICQAERLRPSCDWTAAGSRAKVPVTVVSCLCLGSLRAI